jgi:hypothetical protein
MTCDHGDRRALARPLPLPEASQIGVDFRGYHPKSPQIGVEFSNQVLIGVGFRGNPLCSFVSLVGKRFGFG